MSLIDLTYLRSFCDGDEAFVAETIETLLEKLPEELRQLEQATATQQWHAAYKAVHSLKSSLHLAGLAHLYDSLKQLEGWTKNEENLDQAKERISQILALGNGAVGELQVWLKEYNSK
jgi:HPt (histidine-containing phosphotransfer) domain-containing protein